MNNITFKVNGSVKRILNLLFYEGIEIFNVTHHNDCTKFSVKKKDKRKTIDIIEKINATFEIVNYGITTNIKREILTHSGIYLGFAIMIVAIIMLSFLTLDIKITGNNITKDSDVMNVLKKHNVKILSPKLQNCQIVTNDILNLNENIANVTLKYDGCRLNVDILETQKYPLYKKDKEGNIIANCDGIITKIILISGTPKVKVGDTVRKGDVLIEPFKKYGEDEKIVDTTASGEVYARTFIGEDIKLQEKNYFYIPTSKVKIVNRFWNTNNVVSPFKHYTKTVESRRLYSLIPLKYDVVKYVEMKEVVKLVSDKNFKNIMIQQAKDRLDDRLFDGENKIREWIFEKRLDNVYIISVYYEVEKLISGGRLEQV